jgi:diaminopropionate ammonia-lyase
MKKFLINPNSQQYVDIPPFSKKALNFHRSLPTYKPTPLYSPSSLAKSMGCSTIYIKDESDRLGLPSFKILGASFAAIRALEEKFRMRYNDIQDFKEKLRELGDIWLITATDGNHGRSVAHIAKILGLKARIYVPEYTKVVRIKAIESEGAYVVVVNGNYDKAVETAACQEGIILQDTAYPGYENIPRHIVEGYSTMMWEIEQQLSTKKLAYPDVVIAPIGVGSFISAVIQFYKSTTKFHPIILGVEPEKAPCALEAIRQDKIVTLKESYESLMAGLSCGKISNISFPVLKSGVDAFLLVSDKQAISAMRALQSVNIVSGESGAASFAGLSLLFSEEGRELREIFSVNASSNILIFSTEGATDPKLYKKIIELDNIEDIP